VLLRAYEVKYVSVCIVPTAHNRLGGRLVVNLSIGRKRQSKLESEHLLAHAVSMLTP
jgi:hypothetical protein